MNIMMTVSLAFCVIQLNAQTNIGGALSQEPKTFFTLEPVVEPVGKGWWQRFQFHYVRDSDDLFSDRFGFARSLRTVFELEKDGRAFYDSFGDRGAQVLGKSIVYAGRNTLEGAPVIRWFEARGEILPTFFRELFIGSVASPSEEELRPGSIEYEPIRERWWSRVEERGVRYGIRPLQTDPYGYLSFPLGNRRNPLILAHTRYHFEGFSAHRFSFATSFRPMNGYAVDVDGSYEFENGSQLGDGITDVAIRLQKRFTRGILSLGLKVVDSEQGKDGSPRFVVQYHLQW